MAIRIWTAALLGTLAFSSFVDGNEAIVEKVTLEWRGQSLSPVDISVPWKQRIQLESRFLEFEANKVAARKPGSHEPDWTSESKGSGYLFWLGSAGDIGYIQAFDYDLRAKHPDKVPLIRRIRLSTGEWLTDLSIPNSTDADVLLGILASDDYVFVLGATLEAQRDSRENKVMTQYRLTRYDVPAGKVIWTELFTSAPESGYGGPFLWAAKMPNRAVPNVRPLSFIGKNLLVCAGSKQAILCLEPESGKLVWAIERIWEFERGFVGPSVWSHYISRYGLSPFSRDNSNPVDPKLSQDFDERWSCNIVGGPIVVPTAPNERNPEPASTFVAVGNSPIDGRRDIYSSYLQDCIIYEISERGEVVGVSTLPRMVTGSQCRVVNDGVVWACQSDAFARLKPSRRVHGIGGSGPGSPDMRIDLEWYREYEPVNPDAWLVVGKSGDPMAFSNGSVFKSLTGGYVQKDSKRIVLFPLSTFGYEDGKREDMLLRVPLTEDATLPTTNYSGDPKGSTHTFGPYLLAITGLNAERELLAVTLGTDRWSAIVTFKLPSSGQPMSRVEWHKHS
jgi:hypothetical protein